MSVINTNITSMIGQQNLAKSQNALQTSMERLSSGLRINSAKDDAAGQAIANRMSAQITGLSTAQRNANDGISVAQTAEGGLNQVNDNLQRIRELAVQAENGTNSSDDLDSIQNEINQRLEEIDRISRETDFNGTKVLGENEGATDPALRTINIQVGAQDGQSIEIKLEQINRETLNLSGFNVNGKGETPNAEATEEMLKLAEPSAVTELSNDITQYTLSEQNKEAATTDVLSELKADDTVAVDGTTYTLDGDSGRFKFDGATDNAVSSLRSSMQAEPGETINAEVTIGGESTKITIDADGNISNADSENALYLDSTGNLTETFAGSPDRATVDNLSLAIATTAGSSIAIEGGVEFTGTANTAVTLGNTNGAGPTDVSSIAAGLVASDNTNTVDADVELNGVTTSIEIDENGDITDGTDALFLASDGSLTTTDTGTALTADNLVETVAALEGSITLTAAANATGTFANDDVITGQGVTANTVGESVSENGMASIIAGFNGASTVTIGADDADDVQVISITSDGADVTDIDFAAASGANAIQSGAVYFDSDGFTSSEFTDVNYFVQADDSVTNDSGQRIYQEDDGSFTTDDVTVGERTVNALGQLDDALSKVDGLRSDLGAIQNRMESAIENLSTTETNLSAARSRIEDADYATEVANMTRAQILQQAGTSVLAQANQIPQSVLSLLG